LIENKLYEIALEQLTNVRTNSENYKDQIQLAVTQSLQNNPNEAKKIYTTAFALNNDSKYPNHLISLLLDKKCFHEILIIIETLELIIPEDNQLLYNKGVVLESLKYIDEAIECYNKLLIKDPNNMKAYQQLINI